MLVWSLLLIVAVLIALASAPLTGGRREEVSETEIAGVVKRARLPLPRHLRVQVFERLDARGRGMAPSILIGAGVGLAVGIALVFSLNAFWVGPPTMMGGAAIGLAIGVARTNRASATPLGASPAQATADVSSLEAANAGPEAPVSLLRVRDLATTSELVAARLVPVVLVGAAIVARYVHGRLPETTQTSAAEQLLGVSLAVFLIAWLLLARTTSRIANRPRGSGGALTGAWEDTLRAQSVRDVLDASVGVALLGVLGMLLPVAFWLLDEAVRLPHTELAISLALIAAGAAIAGGLLLIVPWAIGRMRGNPAAHLWAGRDFFATGADSAESATDIEGAEPQDS